MKIEYLPKKNIKWESVIRAAIMADKQPALNTEKLQTLISKQISKEEGKLTIYRLAFYLNF